MEGNREVVDYKESDDSIEHTVGYGFDERMCLHKMHKKKHFECPERIMSIHIHFLQEE